MAIHLIIKQFKTRDITMIQDDDNDVCFTGYDADTVLGYSNNEKDVGTHVDLEDKLKPADITARPFWDNPNLQQHTTFINEPGLYSLILRSKLDSSKQFKRLTLIKKKYAHLRHATSF